MIQRYHRGTNEEHLPVFALTIRNRIEGGVIHALLACQGLFTVNT